MACSAELAALLARPDLPDRLIAMIAMFAWRYPALHQPAYASGSYVS
jgi:hypothetical protein